MILIGLYTQEDGNSWWSSRRTWRSMDMRGTRCLRFRSDPERTCKWTVCLTLDFILCDWYRLHRVVCLCGMLRCKWSRLLLKSKVLWWWSKHGLCGVALCITWIREPHTSVWVKNGIVTAGRARRFFLARVVSVTYQPWHLYTFHLCGCCCCEAPRFDRTIRVRWSHSLAHLRPKGRGNAVFRHFNPHRWTGPDDPRAHLSLGPETRARASQSGKDDPLPWFTDGNPTSNTTFCGFDCRA